MTKTLFVTGATGFIGSNFVAYALTQGFSVRALTRNLNLVNVNLPIEWVEGDLTADRDWKKHLKSVDVIVHAAGEIHDENLMPSVNLDAPLRLVNSAIDSGVRRWVQLSSVGAYGAVQDGLVDEYWDDCPVGLYEKTKSDFDLLLMKVAKRSRLETCIVRPSNVYGVGMRNRSIEELLKAIKMKRFAYIGAEGASANYVHVQDVVQALDLCVRHPKAANQTYIVSAWSTIEEMVSGLAEGAGLATPSLRIPLPVASSVAKAMQWWPHCPLTPSRVRAMNLRSRYSTRKIEIELGWNLTVPVKEGMCEFTQGLLQ